MKPTYLFVADWHLMTIETVLHLATTTTRADKIHLDARILVKETQTNQEEAPTSLVDLLVDSTSKGSEPAQSLIFFYFLHFIFFFRSCNSLGSLLGTVPGYDWNS